MARAAILTSGNFKTGTPTPSFTITTPMTFVIASSGNVAFLVLDEWVTSDGGASTAYALDANQQFSYRLDAGPIQTAAVYFLYDNSTGTAGGITANDGFLGFLNPFAVTAGQMLTLLPGSASFGSGGAGFNTLPAVFNGNTFVTDDSGARVGSIPEPSTFAALIGVGLIGVIRSRRRRRDGAVNGLMVTSSAPPPG